MCVGGGVSECAQEGKGGLLGSRKTETSVEKILRVVVTVASSSGENSAMVK